MQANHAGMVDSNHDLDLPSSGAPASLKICRAPETRWIGIRIAAELFDVAGRLLPGWIGSFALPDLPAAPDSLLPVAV